MDTILTNEYSVWLEPSASSELGTLIATYAKLAGTPSFLPHVTLISGLSGNEQDLIERTQKLVGRGAMHLSLGKATLGETYHKCFYLECRPSAKLSELREYAEELFSIEGPYHPHLSLAYGLVDLEQTHSFLTEIEGKEFTLVVEHVSLWRAYGNVEEWQRVARWPL